MKNLRNIKSNVMQKAWYLVRNAGLTLSEALKKAWKFINTDAKVLLASSLEYFKITFVKKETGEITTRLATNAKEKDGKLLFFSLSDNGFRQAIIDNILSVEPSNVEIKEV